MKIKAGRDGPRRLLPFDWSGLRARMTISYVAVTLGSVLSFVLLGALVTGFFSTFLAEPVTASFLTAVQQQAQSYALVAGAQARDGALDPRANFIPGELYSVTLPDVQNQTYHVFAPYIATPPTDTPPVAFALLVAPDGRVAASSYPARYAAGMPVSSLSSTAPVHAIDQGLAGKESIGMLRLSATTFGYAAEPVWNQQHRTIGAVVLQVPAPARDSILSKLLNGLLSNIILLVLVTPVGVFFGWITARDLVRRVRQLALATAQFAGGDYTQRVASSHPDEIGQLERQFNQMAEQLSESIARRQQLAAQNARLEERSRISRELHDAVSQDLFSLRMLADGLHEAAQAGSSAADLRPQVALLEQTTANMTREMRALLLEMRPAELEHLGLEGALRELARAYSTRLGITVTADVRPVALDVKTEHALLRIAQEALANAARHSGATLIALHLASDGTRVELAISDNGGGFVAQESDQRHGLGLRIMRERVEELHGTFDLTTTPGRGTSIAVALPREPQGPQEQNDD